MGENRTVADTTPHLADDFIVADADYYRTKARQCFRLARAAEVDEAATTLLSLGETFQAKARSLSEGD